MTTLTAPCQADNRKHSRYPVALPAQIRGLPASTRNLSLLGLQLAFPSMNIPLIASDLDSGSLLVTVALPHEGPSRVQCQMAYLCDYGDEHLIGLQFVEFPDRDSDKLERYLASLAASDSTAPLT